MQSQPRYKNLQVALDMSWVAHASLCCSCNLHWLRWVKICKSSSLGSAGCAGLSQRTANLKELVPREANCPPLGASQKRVLLELIVQSSVHEGQLRDPRRAPAMLLKLCSEVSLPQPRGEWWVCTVGQTQPSCAGSQGED